MFLTREDGNMRLSGCVFRDMDGEPVYVEEVNYKTTRDTSHFVCSSYYILRDNERKIIPYEDLDLSPVPLGFMNFKGEAYFSSRLPKRISKHGLCTSNWQARSIKTGKARVELLSVPLALSIKGKYPSVSKCYELSKNEAVNSQAWCRNFAFYKNQIIYKDLDVVGIMEPNLKKYELFSNYFYLKEALEESLE